MIHEKIHRAFNHIAFYEEGHTYMDLNTVRQIPSVTQTIGKYVKPFNNEYWTVYKALERAGYHVRKDRDLHGIYLEHQYTPLQKARDIAVRYCNVTNEQIDMEWQSMSEQGKRKGSALHNYIEKAIYGKRDPDPDAALQVAEEWLRKDYIEGPYVPVRMEVIVGNELIAGQLDNLSTYSHFLVLRDYKTDKKIDRKNRWDTMLGPFSHLEQCEFNKYSLQLSTYAYLLSTAGIKVDVLQIIHFPKNETTYEVIDIPYLNEEAEFLCRKKVAA